MKIKNNVKHFNVIYVLVVFLLFVPYGIRQMRVSRRILIPVMAAGIILAGTAEAVKAKWDWLVS